MVKKLGEWLAIFFGGRGGKEVFSHVLHKSTEIMACPNKTVACPVFTNINVLPVFLCPT